MKRTHFLPLMLIASVLLGGCASQYIRTGKQAHADLRYQDAIWSLEKGLKKKDNPDARRLLAESYMMVNDFRKAGEEYSRISLYTDNSDQDRLLQGQALMANGKYDEARGIFEGILSRNPQDQVASSLLQSCRKLNDLRRDSLLLQITPVNIPTSSPVYSAYPYNNGLIITSPSSKGDADPYTNRAFTDLYFSRQEGSSWTAPEPIEEVNGPYHDAVAAVSPDGQQLIFTRSFQLNSGKLGGDENKVSNTQLYVSRKTADGKWGMPELLPFCQQKFMFAHPAFSPDGKTLYFASDMSGQGKMDIFRSAISDGAWGTPENLGSEINTPGNELFPGMRGDGRLYFSSDGHNSLGGLDILYSELTDGAWSQPRHVSYPVNSATDDFSIQWNPDGKTGYFTSDRTGADRIYSFTEFAPLIVLEGLVLSKDKSVPLTGARITVLNMTDGTEEVLFSDKEGKYSLELKPGKDYKIKTELDGYFTQTDDLSTRDVFADKKFRKVTELGEVHVTSETDDPSGDGDGGGKDAGKDKNDRAGIYAIDNIYWDFDKAEIRPDAVPYLNALVKLFRDNQNLNFEILSHCDCRGGLTYNDDLSRRRAKAVLEYLVDHGVPRSIIKSKGMGKRKLLNRCNCKEVPPCEEELHQENRRTEFIVTRVR
jgi:peptidoglycan-associated lipoprotein